MKRLYVLIFFMLFESYDNIRFNVNDLVKKKGVHKKIY